DRRRPLHVLSDARPRARRRVAPVTAVVPDGRTTPMARPRLLRRADRPGRADVVPGASLARRRDIVPQCVLGESGGWWDPPLTLGFRIPRPVARRKSGRRRSAAPLTSDP